MNYITETFDMVRRGFLFGWNTFCDILDRTGIPHETYFVILIGFAVVSILVSSVMNTFRGSADSAVGLHNQYEARKAAEAAKAAKAAKASRSKKE